MTDFVVLGLCGKCGQPLRVPAYSYPPQPPACACTMRPDGPLKRTGVLAFEREMSKAYDVFLEECSEDDVRDTIIRLQSFVAMVGTAYAEGDGKGFISGLVSLAAVAKVLSATVDEEDDDVDDDDDGEEGCVT